MSRPVIGITTYLITARWSWWEAEAALIPSTYVSAVERAGGRALLVPPAEEATDDTLDILDGLILSGGSDLDPALYGAEPHPETSGVIPERDRFELTLLNAALSRDMPVLAICRGSQVLNVAMGGNIIQHLPDVVGDEKHKHTVGVFAEHDVEILPGTRLAAIVQDHAPVKSHHHQGFDRIGAGLREAARAEDGVVEALEDPERRFAVGVLWHPEEGEDAALFDALVDEARAYRATRDGA